MKPLSCLLGRHLYRTRIRIVGSRVVCIRCGKVLTPPYETLEDIRKYTHKELP